MDTQLKRDLDTEEFIATQFQNWLRDLGAKDFASSDVNEFYNDICYDLETEYGWDMFQALNPWAKRFNLKTLKEDLEGTWDTYIDHRLDERAGMKGHV